MAHPCPGICYEICKEIRVLGSPANLGKAHPDHLLSGSPSDLRARYQPWFYFADEEMDEGKYGSAIKGQTGSHFPSH